MAPRIYEVLKEHVKQDLTNSSNLQSSESIKVNQGENVFEIKKRDVKVDPDTGKIVSEDKTELVIEYCFMLLSNVTALKAG